MHQYQRLFEVLEFNLSKLLSILHDHVPSDDKDMGRYKEPNHVDVSRPDSYTGNLEKKHFLQKLVKRFY